MKKSALSRKNCGDYPLIFNYISSLFTSLETELKYETPFQLLVAVMMSAQTTDKQVNKITDHFFTILKHPQDAVNLGQEKIQEEIKSVNYCRAKAKHIYQTSLLLLEWSAPFMKSLSRKNYGRGKGGFEKSKIQKKLTLKELVLFKQYGYYIPETESELTKLPGVGEKTAKVIQYVLFKKPVIAVDTHVHRVTNRLGIVATKTPEETSKQIQTKIPKEYRNIAHHAFILFGRYYCKAIKPKCETCQLQQICKFYNEKLKQ